MTRPCPGAPPPTAASFEVPRGACDCHLHVLGPYARYPLAADRPYTAPEAPLAAMVAMLDTMRLDRAVVAHVSAHGADQRVTLDALEALGDRARAIVMLAPSMSDAELARLNSLGVRGVRLAHAFGYAVTRDALRRIGERVGPLGWHIAIWPSGLDELRLIASLIETLAAPVVLDHLAGHCWDPRLGVDQEGFTLLRSLLESRRVWLKLSGMYRASTGAFPWPELIPFAATLAAEHPQRLLWASDWPHVGLHGGNMPNSGELLDWLLTIGCDDARRRQILVDNPIDLYGFAKVAAERA